MKPLSELDCFWQPLTNIAEFLLVLPEIECAFGSFSRGERENAELCSYVHTKILC